MAIAQIRLWSFAQECDEIGKRITYVNLDKRAGVSKGWEEELFGLLKSYTISYLPFVPDAGHAKLLVMAENDKQTMPVVLTTEEEGVAFFTGCVAWGQEVCIIDAEQWCR